MSCKRVDTIKSLKHSETAANALMHRGNKSARDLHSDNSVPYMRNHIRTRTLEEDPDRLNQFNRHPMSLMNPLGMPNINNGNNSNLNNPDEATLSSSASTCTPSTTLQQGEDSIQLRKKKNSSHASQRHSDGLDSTVEETSVKLLIPHKPAAHAIKPGKTRRHSPDKMDFSGSDASSNYHGNSRRRQIVTTTSQSHNSSKEKVRNGNDEETSRRDAASIQRSQSYKNLACTHVEEEEENDEVSSGGFLAISSQNNSCGFSDPISTSPKVTFNVIADKGAVLPNRRHYEDSSRADATISTSSNNTVQQDIYQADQTKHLATYSRLSKTHHDRYSRKYCSQASLVPSHGYSSPERKPFAATLNLADRKDLCCVKVHEQFLNQTAYYLNLQLKFLQLFKEGEHSFETYRQVTLQALRMTKYSIKYILQEFEHSLEEDLSPQ